MLHILLASVFAGVAAFGAVEALRTEGRQIWLVVALLAALAVAAASARLIYDAAEGRPPGDWVVLLGATAANSALMGIAIGQRRTSTPRSTR